LAVLPSETLNEEELMNFVMKVFIGCVLAAAATITVLCFWNPMGNPDSASTTRRTDVA